MTLRDKRQGNQRAGETAHSTSSAELRDLTKERSHEVRGEKKKKTWKERARSYRAINPPVSLHWTTTASISSELRLSEP